MNALKINYDWKCFFFFLNEQLRTSFCIRHVVFTLKQLAF